VAGHRDYARLISTMGIPPLRTQYRKRDLKPLSVTVFCSDTRAHECAVCRLLMIGCFQRVVSVSVTDALAGEVGALVEPTLRARGFEYVRTKRHFQRGAVGRQDYVGVNVVRPSAGAYAIAFYLGVRHELVEEAIARLKRLTKPNKDARTIMQYSVNVGPGRAQHFEQAGSWYASGPPLTDRKVVAELIGFVERFAVPWIDRYADLHAVRESLANADRCHINIFPHEQVLAMDLVWEDREHIASYLKQIGERLPRLVANRRSEFMEFYALVRGERPDLFPAWEP